MKTVSSQLASLTAAGGTLRRQLAPFVRYVALLTAVVLFYGWLFHVIMAWEGQDHTWFTGIYWALTVMSTLGFGDITFHSDLGRVFSSIVLLTGMLLLLIILPFLFIRFVYAPWLDQRSRSRIHELRAVPAGTEGHVLICVDDPIAMELISHLELAGVPAFLIEPDPDRALQLEDARVPVITGEIDAVETYRAARVQHARLVFANASDTVNSNIVLTVRELSESVSIAAVAEVEDSIDVLELSDATHVLGVQTVFSIVRGREILVLGEDVNAVQRSIRLSRTDMPGAGVEPARPCGQRLLRPPRLPFRHPGKGRWHSNPARPADGRRPRTSPRAPRAQSFWKVLLARS